MSTRPPTRRALLLPGAVYLAVIAVITGGLVAKGAGAFDETFPVSTEVPTVGAGLPVGADVKLRGLSVGRVSAVKVRRDGAQVSIDLDPELAKHVPASVEARVLTLNVFGVPYIELVAKGAETPAVTENAVLKADTSAEAVELAVLYETAYDVLIAIEPAKLNSALTAIADTVRDNGPEIGAMIAQSASYLSKLTPNRARFERDLVLLERVLSRAQVATPVLLDALDNTARLARVLVENREGLAELLAVGRQALDTTQGILEAMEPRLINVTRVSAPVFETLAANQSSGLASLRGLGLVARRIFAAKNKDGGITARIWVAGRPYPTYSAADCPRYGSLSGPNCGSARVAPRYAGTASTVGSEEELTMLTSFTGSDDPEASGLVGLVAGPALRGQTVVTR